MLNEELRQIGFKLSVGDVERKLVRLFAKRMLIVQYPHFLSHHLGSDLHDCPTSDRSSTYVPT
jgi:intermediate cleaving peptidase 55